MDIHYVHTVGETKTHVGRRVKKKRKKHGPRKQRRGSRRKKHPSTNQKHGPNHDSAIVNKQVTKYKTEMCRFVQWGRKCPHQNCMYAHSEEELRERPRHPKYKCQNCRNYWQKGGVCYYAHRCDYLHRDLKNCTMAGNSFADIYYWYYERLPVFASIENGTLVSS